MSIYKILYFSVIVSIFVGCDNTKQQTSNMSNNNSVHIKNSSNDPINSTNEFKPLNLHTKSYNYFLKEYACNFNCGLEYGVIESQIYPIGWSKDGKFAYIIVHANEAEDSSRVEFFIQDMVSDSIVFSIKIENEDDNYLAQNIQGKQNDIDNLLTRFSIVRTQSELKEFPIHNGSSDIDVSKQASYKTNPEFENNEKFLSDIVISLYSIENYKVAKTKVLYRKNLLKTFTYDMNVVGYIKSPFEERVAIIASRVVRGWEGMPHITKIDMIGARIDNIKSLPISSQKYEYTKSFIGKYAFDVGLFEKNILKKQLINLLGKENYKIFLKNMSAQLPIELVENRYVYVSGLASHKGGEEEAVIEIDLVTSMISVGILHNRKILYLTEKNDKNIDNICVSKIKEGSVQDSVSASGNS